jgi:hypothetical protein
MVEDPIPHQTSNHKSESGSYMHHFHKVWWQLAFYRILNMFFDNHFLFFVTVTAISPSNMATIVTINRKLVKKFIKKLF